MKLLPLLSLSAGVLSQVIQLNSKNFDSVVYDSGKDTFVEFYATWCSHCNKLAPTIDQLAETYEGSNVQIAKIECDENRVICSQFDIKGFPTMKVFKKDLSIPVEFQGTRGLDAFIKFIGENTDGYVYIPKVESDVVQASDLDFDDLVNQGKDVYVVFTASWCGHCKNLHPDWEKLAKIFKDDDIIIAEVSTTDSPCEELRKKYEIAGFPTILTFKDGEMIPFEGYRALEGLVSWVNKVSGLHRTVDGGLDSSAGLIPELDSKIQQVLQLGDNQHGAITDLIGLAQDTYYKKVLNKILNGEESFIAKEITRLNKLLDKGKSLTRDKLDSLQTRLNILNQFSQAF
jgi:protein disulfide-isomerase A6